MTTDVHTFIGPYPFRHLPHPDPEVLVRVLDRERIADAWVGYLHRRADRTLVPSDASWQQLARLGVGDLHHEPQLDGVTGARSDLVRQSVRDPHRAGRRCRVTDRP